jgi:hypothetical protein
MGIVANEFCATIIAGIVAAIFAGSKRPVWLARRSEKKCIVRAPKVRLKTTKTIDIKTGAAPQREALAAAERFPRTFDLAQCFSAQRPKLQLP